MGARADGARLARPLFQAGDGGSRPTSALHLWLDRVTLNVARPLNQLWHSTLPRYGRGFIKNQSDLCYAAEHEGRYYAVAILSNPVARNLPQDTWLELRRLAVAPDAPRNTASRILRIVALLVRRDRPAIVRLVSYHAVGVHTGAIYRAAGWTPTKQRRGSEWSCGSRPRPGAQCKADKQRWEKSLAD
jgi:hypothetical protein